MQDPQKPRKIIAIVGPTASGKTLLGIALAHQGDNSDHGRGEIISADSRQIYRGMDIGTAKATREERALVPHHLVDIRNPDEDYAVAEFKRDAEAAIDDIIALGKLPIIVGGTGLYVRAVVENLDIPEVAADQKLRREIEADIEREGLAAVFKKLVALDPEAAYIVDPKNPRRIVRALEVAILTGKPFTAQRRKNASRYDVLEIGIDVPPEILRERIDRRIDQMMRDGLMDEVKKLLKKYGGPEQRGAGGRLPVAFDAIGYREIIAYLDDAMSLEDAIVAMKLNTWHFAKRQMTWFKKDTAVRWVKNLDETEALVAEFLEK